MQYDSKQKQLTQIIDEKKNSYKDPIMQAEAQKNHLQTWLQQFGIIGPPIETLVVIAYPSTIIENIHHDPYVYEKIIHTASLNQQIGELEKNHTNDVLTNLSIKKLAATMLQRNKPLRTDVLGDLNIDESHFVKGVICKNCKHHPMVREYKGWFCPCCKNRDAKAHERDIYDYFLLHGDTITNSECRNYLGIESPSTSSSVLTSMNLRQTGNNNSSRKYHIPNLSGFPQKSYIPRKVQQFLQKKNIQH